MTTQDNQAASNSHHYFKAGTLKARNAGKLLVIAPKGERLLKSGSKGSLGAWCEAARTLKSVMGKDYIFVLSHGSNYYLPGNTFNPPATPENADLPKPYFGKQKGWIAPLFLARMIEEQFPDQKQVRRPIMMLTCNAGNGLAKELARISGYEVIGGRRFMSTSYKSRALGTGMGNFDKVRNDGTTSSVMTEGRFPVLKKNHMFLFKPDGSMKDLAEVERGENYVR